MAWFEVAPYDRSDKWIHVQGPGDLSFEVDYDDVNHDEVEQSLPKMLAILNERWADALPDRSDSDA